MTVRVNGTLRFTPPKVPVTVSVEVPGGVPLDVPLGVDLPLLPLQLISSTARSISAADRAMVGSGVL